MGIFFILVPGPLLTDPSDGRIHAGSQVDRLRFSVADMSLHSLNLADRFQDHQGDSLLLLSQFRHMTSQVIDYIFLTIFSYSLLIITTLLLLLL